MSRNTTIGMIVQDFCEQLPNYADSMAFVDYSGSDCIDVYLEDGCYIRYDYCTHDIVMFQIDHSFEDYYLARYDDTLFPFTESTYRERFGELLRGRMYAKHISRRELAKSLGISEMSLYRYMRGERTPSGYLLYILNRHLQNSDSDPWRLI